MASWEIPNISNGFINKSQSKITADVAVCIPHQQMTTIEWAISLRNMNLPVNTPFYAVRGIPIDVARQEMADLLIKNDIKYSFWLDSDNIGPTNSIDVLRDISEKMGLPIVSGLYWAKKKDVVIPCAWRIADRQGNNVQFGSIDKYSYKFNGEVLDWKTNLEKNNILECDVVGLGCCLINNDVFRQLKTKNPNKPFFEWGVKRDHLDIPHVSEDFYFFLRTIDELGIHPHVATGVRFGHIANCKRLPDDGTLEILTF